MSAAAGGGAGSPCLGAAAGASCSSAGSFYAAVPGGGAGVAGRLPARVLEHIFSYLELVDLMRCALVCWHWSSILADEKSEVWRSLCSRSLSDEALRSDILCNLPTYRGKVGPLDCCFLHGFPLNITSCSHTLADSCLYRLNLHVAALMLSLITKSLTMPTTCFFRKLESRLSYVYFDF